MSIFYAGNTYLFGATVAPVLGTGNGQYVFSGLSPDTSYGFLVWSYNSGGTSSIVGPLQILTASMPVEIREAFVAYAGTYQHRPSFSMETYSSYGITGADVNLFTSSDNLANTYSWNWPRGVSYFIFSGYTAPDGSTTAWNMAHLPNGNGKSVSQTVFLDSGNTYILSFYLDLTNSSRVDLIRRPGTDWIQIGATTGIPLGSTADTFMTVPAGSTGWIRVNYVYYHKSLTRNKLIEVIKYGGTSTTPAGSTLSTVIWHPQLEKVTG